MHHLFNSKHERATLISALKKDSKLPDEFTTQFSALSKHILKMTAFDPNCRPSAQKILDSISNGACHWVFSRSQMDSIVCEKNFKLTNEFLRFPVLEYLKKSKDMKMIEKSSLIPIERLIYDESNLKSSETIRQLQMKIANQEETIHRLKEKNYELEQKLSKDETV